MSLRCGSGGLYSTCAKAKIAEQPLGLCLKTVLSASYSHTHTDTLTCFTFHNGQIMLAQTYFTHTHAHFSRWQSVPLNQQIKNVHNVINMEGEGHGGGGFSIYCEVALINTGCEFVCVSV